jgi:FtsP/CotA-like multicopper oxidase with cupredoxin domain
MAAMRRPWLLLLVCCSKLSEPPDAGPAQPSQPAGWDDGIRLFEAVDMNPDPSVVEVSLDAKVAPVTLGDSPTVVLWTYDGHLPGPLIRLKRGDTLVVHFSNHLPEPTTIHWHGIRVPAAMDGTDATQTPVPPGGTFDYRFTVPDPGLFWYHPHVDSSAQVGYGLYGPIVVEDPQGPALGDEVVLVLSDLSVEDGGVAPGDESGWFGDYFGREGGLLLVNGRPVPRLLAGAGLPQRWKIVNAARARFFKLQFPAGVAQRIGGDVGLIASPQPAGALVLTPGERAEVWFAPTATAPGHTELRWFDADRFHIGTLEPDQPLVEVEAFDAGAPQPSPPPAALAALTPLDTRSANTRTIELMEVVSDAGTLLGINGKTYSDSVPIMVHVGDTEVWQVHNSTGYDHTFHLHGFPFQPRAVNGMPWPVLEQKDTVLVPAMGTLELAVYFDNRPGMWMLHCHILDHVELGMMAMLHVMP